MLADARRQDRALGSGIAQLLEAELRLQRGARLALLVGQRELLTPAGQLALPRRRVGRRRPRLAQVADRRDQLGDDGAAVADDRHVGPAHLALLGGVDVDVDDLGLLGEAVEPAGDAVVEAGAEGDQQVAALHRRHRRGVAVHPGHAEGQRVVVGERATGHQRGDDVDVGQLGELAQLGSGTRLEDAAADVEHRAGRLEDQPGSLADHPRVTLDRRPIARQRGGDVGVGRPVPLHLRLQHVLGHVDEHRAGPAGGGDVERLADRQRQLLGRHHQLVVLGRRAGDADGVALLEGVAADRLRRHLPGDRDHRDRVHVGVHQRRDEVRRRRTRRHQRHAGTAGDVGIALGHVPGALLVAHEDVADRRLQQRVVGRQDAPAGEPEDDLDRLHLQ